MSLVILDVVLFWGVSHCFCSTRIIQLGFCVYSQNVFQIFCDAVDRRNLFDELTGRQLIRTEQFRTGFCTLPPKSFKEQWKKHIGWLDYLGDLTGVFTTLLLIRITINHYKDPYEETRISLWWFGIVPIFVIPSLCCQVDDEWISESDHSLRP